MGLGAEREKRLLGAVMFRPDLLDELQALRGQDFGHPLHQLAMETVQELRRTGSPVDPLTISERIGVSHLSYLMEVFEAGAGWHSDALREDARRVSQAGTRREARRTLASVLERLEHENIEVDQALEEARREIAELETRGTAGGPLRIGDLLDPVFRDLEERSSNRATYAVPTGLDRFDTTFGPFRPGRLIVIAARPGIGKTSLVRSFGLHAARQRIPVLLFSMEMTREEITETFISSATGFSAESISRGQLHQAQRVALEERAREELADLPLYVDDRMLTATQVCATARRWRTQHKSPIALIAVDYLGLIRAEKDGETRTLEVGRMAWAMKVLAKDTRCPVLLVSQLNRSSEKEQRKPQLSDLRDSGEIEQHATTVIFPHRSVDQFGSGPADLVVAKNRFGKRGEIGVWWNAETMSFGDGP